MDMAKTVLLLGVRADLLDTVKKELQTPGVEFLAGTGVADAEAAFRQADIDHVIIGGGLDLEARRGVSGGAPASGRSSPPRAR